MKKYLLLIAMMVMVAVCVLIEAAPHYDWLKIHYTKNGLSRVSSHLLEDVANVRLTAANDSIGDAVVDDSADDASDSDAVADDNDSIPGSAVSGVTDIRITLKDGEEVVFGLDTVESVSLSNHIPTVYIDTDPYVNEIPNKTDYLTANFRYIPYGDGTDTVVNTVSIRGRGNTTWYYVKKPYRLKFEKKQTLGNLNKAKSFVLIANYLDNSLMKNVVAFKIAEILEMPYVNKPLPVNLVLNGKPRGSYMMTNKVGINSGSVDIDEKEGVLWELDTYYDEEFRFRTKPFNLYCMLKDPDLYEITDSDPEQIEEIWDYWQKDLNDALQAVKEGRWQEAFDAEQFVKYILVNDLTMNLEVRYPKSMYLFKKTKGGKYILGPVWDFDWAYGYAKAGMENIAKPDYDSYEFFTTIFADPEFREMFRAEFENFCDNHLDDLMTYIDEYAATIRDSALEDAELWPADHVYDFEVNERNTGRFDENIEVKLKGWLLRRIEHIKNHPNFSLY